MPLPRTEIGGCCRGCKSRSVEPNCHSYCPPYLAAKMEHDARAARDKQRAAVAIGLIDQESRRFRKAKKRRRKR